MESATVWSVHVLDELAERVDYGLTTSAKDCGDGPKFLRITDIQGGLVDWSVVPVCECEPVEQEKYRLREGDIVFARTGATTGKSYLITDSPRNAMFASYLIRVRPNNRVLPAYLAHFFHAPDYWEQVSRSSSGSAQPGVNATKLKNLSIPVPPLPEQERIVAILDEAFAAIATATANTEKNLANARELFEGYQQSVFQRRTFTWPEHHLGTVCENLDSKRVPITKSKRKPGDIPYYGASGVVDHVADYLFDGDLLLVSEDGANLLARTYPIAFSISGKAWVNNHAHVLRFQNIVHQKFVECYLNSITLEPYVSGMAQPKLNQKALNSIPVPWSEDMKAVEDVVSCLEAANEESETLVHIYEGKLALLAELRQSILHKAFTGELTADSKAADRVLTEANI